MLSAAENSGDGWFRLGDLKVSERMLAVAAAINPMSNPRFASIGATGIISIGGAAGSYDGVCGGGPTS